ncbi:Head-to-tail connector protein, podovirus-type [uncultured Caudovirales phage]|uniref:Head-to-tail connector protein, podovirus-type n=1 Tax=uncultured Caudovirales phage TaxID=2100421 RepID=A0A6J7VP21_9CAUD|nr:Head-to-tail connector protein, podovirus-type [uncultured Caudovirales phage]
MNPSELIDVSNRLISERYEWDRVWEQSARLVLPMQDREFRRGAATMSSREAIDGWAAGPRSVDKIAERFDITAVMAAERLATGLLSLVTPDSEKWMALGISDPLGAVEATDEETRWLERQRDYLMSTMYTPATGWNQANGGAMRSMVVFGTGIYFIEEAWGKRGQNDVAVPYTFTPLPLSENYLTVDGQNEIDQDYRRFRMSARSALTLFGDKLHPMTSAMANDPQRWHQQVDFLHWVGYRREPGMQGDPMRHSPVESVYIEVEKKHEIRRGGFNYFPVVAYHWNQVPSSPYGESPVMLVMAEIKGGNILAKNSLLSAQQLTKPPVGTSNDSTMQRPNLNPGAINFGALDSQGNLKIKPIILAQNPSLVQSLLDGSRNQIKEGLYTNLWQILINNPQMTATEALIRSNEKGELLGPIGTKIQAGLSHMTDAALTILEGKGAWRPGAALEPPASIAGRNIKSSFNSPLDRMRRAGELIGIERTIQTIGPLAQIDPSVMDNFDNDEIVKLAQEINGAPKKILRKPEDIAQIRQQRDQQMQAQQALAAAQQAGQAATGLTKGAPAVQGVMDAMQQGQAPQGNG